MTLAINIRHLEKHPVVLEDQVAAGELDIESMDELIRVVGPVTYRLEAQKVEAGVLVQGVVTVEVECDCARCLKTFLQTLDLPRWTVHLPLSGAEAVPVREDCVDLTPFLREDILLALPRHPLCSDDCQGLLREYRQGAQPLEGGRPPDKTSSPWGDLDKLDL